MAAARARGARRPAVAGAAALLLVLLQLSRPTAAARAPPSEGLPAASDAGLGSQGRRLQQLAGFTAGFSDNGITYVGGVVLSNPSKIRPIWYGQWTPTQMDIIRRFLAGLGNSQLQTTQHGYGDIYGNFTRGAEFTLEYTMPLTAYSKYGLTIDQSIVFQMVTDVLAGVHLVYGGYDDIYLVLTGSDITHTGFCTTQCGWHNYTNSGLWPFHYAWVGQMTSCAANNPGSPCLALYQDPSPNGEPGVDGMIPLIAHQIWGTQTNPRSDGWNNGPDEAPDLCPGLTGSARSLQSNGAKWNAVINDRHYYTQGNWLNSKGGLCAMSGTRFNTGWQDADDLRDLIGNNDAECPPTGAMSLFRLQNDPAGAGGKAFSVTLWYNCPSLDPSRVDGSPTAIQPTTYATTTGLISDLTKIGTVACPDRNLLQGVSLVAGNSPGDFQIWYNCIQVTGALACGPKWTPWTSDYEGSLRALNFHEPHCGKNGYLKSFSAQTQTGKFRFEYNCCTMM